MAKDLKKLIDNQSINIDWHKTGVPFNWRVDDIHLHKKMLRGSMAEVEMRIHLNLEGDLSFEPKQTSNSDKNALIKEIKSVLSKNKSKAIELCSYIVKNLWNCAKEDETHFLSIIDHIATQFGLPLKGSIVLKEEMKKAIKRYVDDRREYLISINQDKSVTVGEEC